MPKIFYKNYSPRAETMAVITDANHIIEEYGDRGFILTVRQLYYKFIARDIFPDSWIDPVYNAKRGLPPDTKNTEKNYNKLKDILSRARMAGMIDWEAITDRTRSVKEPAHWDSPNDIVDAAANAYAIDKWEGQPYRVEVWVEKDALVDVISRPCRHLDIPYFSCRGYSSQSSMWRGARRMMNWERQDQGTIILHLSDHDPSGLHMTQDIANKFNLFGAGTDIRRIALTMEQIRELNPPPNPAKATDPRFKEYENEYGAECWELDVLEPEYIIDLVTREVEKIRDEIPWDDMCARESDERSMLRDAANRMKEELEQ